MTNAHDPEDVDLQNEGQWDFGAAESRPGVSRPRAVVSVAFAREDFNKVAECAESHAKRVSEFIREAALEKVASSALPVFTSSTSGPSLFVTRVSGPGGSLSVVSAGGR